jgi:excisionase family DNA binding protein
MLLTTQEAADFLRVSRPTLVKLLETDELPFEMRGRHRRVMLRDVLDYQERSRMNRRGALTELARGNVEAEVLEDIPTQLLRNDEFPE